MKSLKQTLDLNLGGDPESLFPNRKRKWQAKDYRTFACTLFGQYQTLEVYQHRQMYLR